MLGAKYERTVSVHCVRAQGEMLKLLRRFLKENAGFKESIIMHSYGGSKEITESLNKSYANFYYSLSMSSLKRMEILDYIPAEKLLLETDSPY